MKTKTKVPDQQKIEFSPLMLLGGLKQANGINTNERTNRTKHTLKIPELKPTFWTQSSLFLKT